VQGRGRQEREGKGREGRGRLEWGGERKKKRGKEKKDGKGESRHISIIASGAAAQHIDDGSTSLAETETPGSQHAHVPCLSHLLYIHLYFTK